WLFHRVPHPGLRLAGVLLLVVVFARLALNPAVLSYHPRAAFPILNWYLYAYGVATVCLFVAARLLAPPRQLMLQFNVLPLLYALLMLVVGMRKQIAPVRYASLGLLSITVVKLFFHDLSQLDQLYRISAFVVVAIIAMVASFLYQRFLSAAEKTNESKPTITSAP